MEENFAADEMPEKWKWHLPWEMKAHMERVTAARAAKYQNPTSGGTGEDAAPAWEADDADVQEWIREHTTGT